MKSKPATTRIHLVTILWLMWMLIFPVQNAFSANQNTSATGNTASVKINFNDVDIGNLIEFIAELTQKNFIVDRRVKGKVTIISPKEISIDEAYAVFQSVLEVQGFTTVESGNMVKIIPAPDARTKSIQTLIREEAVDPDDKIVTQLIPLRYADPAEVKRLFAPMISKSASVLAYPPTNMLIVTDVHSNIRRLMRILKTIDMPGIGQQIAVIPLQYADAKKTERVLASIFQTRRTPRKGLTSSTIKFVADERTNSIVILASEDDTLRVRRLIDQLDIEVPKGKERFHVYYLENAVAEDLAKVLQSLSQKQATQAKKAKGKGKPTSPVVSEGVLITADKATNSLIIMAEKDDYLLLEDIIKKLDIPRSMVYIECLIMEVNVEKGFGLGSEWIAMGEASHNGRDGAYGGGFSGSETGYNNIGNLLGGVTGIGTLPPGFSLGVFSEPLKIGDFTFPNIAAIVDAYKRDKDVHILSTPQLLTTDNEEASITVGANIPYQTKSGSSTVESYNTYEYKDVGITLKITPQISKDRLIRLKIAQEVKKVDEASTTTDERPTTLTRSIDTTVVVRDKNTVVIGGLIDDQISDSEYKIPCLGDIPGLGWMFKTVTKGDNKTNLYVFLTPHVIQSSEEIKEILEKKKQNMIEDAKGSEIKMYKHLGIDAKPQTIE